MALLIGIDVAGTKRGFHLAAMDHSRREIETLCWSATPVDLVLQIQALGPEPEIIAIDCPHRCCRSGRKTRLAERQLHQQGFRVQWTRCYDQEPAEWMQNGQRLWETLAAAFPRAVLIETFPTVAGRNLSTSPLRLPLAALAPHAKKREWKDFVDACICLDVAKRHREGLAHHVGSTDSGDTDELGLIYY